MAGLDWLVLTLLGLVVVVALVIARARDRLTLVLVLSVIGFALAAVYALVGAPDVAFVAVVVETMLTLVFLAALAGCPPSSPTATSTRRSAPGRRRDVVAGAVAVTVHQAGRQWKRMKMRVEFPRKQLMVVGDRVLIAAEDGDHRTRVGLYLPATAIDSQQVQTGLILATGPGTPVADLSALDHEPWKLDAREGKSRGMQARVGDHAIFFRKAAVEIRSRRRIPRGAAGRHSRAHPRRSPDLTSALPPLTPRARSP